jgi:hypothetical protein
VINAKTPLSTIIRTLWRGANDPLNDVSYRITADTRTAGWNAVAYTVVKAGRCRLTL